MTPDEHIEQAKLRIKWAESVRAGKPIQIQCYRTESADWIDIPNPEFPTWYVRYREKPREPLRIILHQYQDVWGNTWWSSCPRNQVPLETAEFVEVLKNE